MRYRMFIGGCGLVLMIAVTALWACGKAPFTSRELDRLEAADDARWIEMAESLRERGRPALDELFALRDQLLAAPQSSEEAAEQDRQKQLENLNRLIDAVGGQRHCSTSRLFWHTDLAAAIAEAKESGKPILSLRMLGNLTDEFSCANSRFFRSTLYSNEIVSRYLRDHFVLHWKSVRPVPKVTIDFGDGRKLERTLTGNSIHYVLTSDGQPVDALPGLYGPNKFQALLMRAEHLANVVSDLREPEARAEYLVEYHLLRVRQISRDWLADIAKVDPASKVLPSETKGPDGVPTADLDVAFTKGSIEASLYAAIDVEPAKLEAATGDATWKAIAALHAEDARLDDSSRELIRSHNPTAAQAGVLARAKYVAEDPLLKVVRNLENSIAIDTVRNEYQLHRVIHEWFARQEAPADVEALDERVYAELFLTPSSDPWLGLAPPDTYTALENNGVVTSEQ